MGALMISLDINHPDIEEFINCKTDLSRVNFANISVRMNDKFMKAVEEDKDYFLHWPCDKEVYIKERPEYDQLFKFGDVYYKRVRARKLFNQLVANNWDYAEPGILYWDQISKYNLVSEDPNFKYAGTNP